MTQIFNYTGQLRQISAILLKRTEYSLGYANFLQNAYPCKKTYLIYDKRKIKIQLNKPYMALFLFPTGIH